jgi:hypothetical protein
MPVIVGRMGAQRHRRRAVPVAIVRLAHVEKAVARIVALRVALRGLACGLHGKLTAIVC